MGFRDLSLSYALGNEGYRSSNNSSTDLVNASLVQVNYTAALHQKLIAKMHTVISQNINCYGLVQINLDLRVFEV